MHFGGKHFGSILLLAGALAATTLGAVPLQTAPGLVPPGPAAPAADLSVMTYNVKGLPWPIAQGRPAAIRAIGARLAAMRAVGRQPTVVVLQEAFIDEAKAIGDLAGYAYQVHGPYLRADMGVGASAGGTWYLGETRPSALDSGLVILSDLPVTAVARAEFPTDSCAGFDCLAAKGVVMATVDLPGGGSVAIATTHLNSRGASGAPHARTHEAFARQADFLDRFVRWYRGNRPLILAGDFNRAQRPERIKSLTAAMHSAREGLAEAVNQGAIAAADAEDARAIVKSARDMQFLFDGAATRLQVSGADVPFGTEPGGTDLSDHMGFTVRYRLTTL